MYTSQISLQSLYRSLLAPSLGGSVAFVFLDHLLCLLRQLYWLNYISGPSFHFRAAQVLESSERVPLSACVKERHTQAKYKRPISVGVGSDFILV